MPLVEAGDLSGPAAEAAVADALAPLFAPSDAPIDTLLLGCTHYPLLRPIIAALAGPQVAIVDSATATASALAELLDVNGLRSGDPWAEDLAPAATHVQLTTGDPDTFHALASRLFGSAFPDVERIDLAVAAR